MGARVVGQFSSKASAEAVFSHGSCVPFCELFNTRRWCQAILATLVVASNLIAIGASSADAQGVVCAGDSIEVNIGETVIYNGFNLVSGNTELEDRYLEVEGDPGVVVEVESPDPDNVRQSPRFDLPPNSTIAIPIEIRATRLGTFGVSGEQKEDNRLRPDPTDRFLCVVVTASETTTTTSTTSTTVTTPTTGPGTTGTSPTTGPGTTGVTQPPATRPAPGSPRGQAGDIGSPGIASTDDPVQVSTGNFYDTFVDLSFGSSVFALDLTRSYNSVWTLDEVGRATPFSAFGSGWRLGFQSALIERADRSVAVVLPDGKLAVFLPDNGGYERPSDVYGDLSRDGNRFQLEMFNGDVLTYDPAGRLVEVDSPRNQSITITYNEGLLVRVDSSTGLNLRFDYDAEGRITAARSFDGDVPDRAVSYGYGDNGHLRSVTAADGRTMTYDTDSQGRLVAMIDGTDVVVVANDYDDRSRVRRQTAATGEVSAFDYGDDLTVVEITGDDGGGDRSDIFRYESDQRGFTRSITDPAGAAVSFDYGPDGRATSSTTRRASETVRSYDQFGNVTSEEVPGFGTYTYTYRYTANDIDGAERTLHRLRTVETPFGGTYTYSYTHDYIVPSLIEGPAGHRVENEVVNGLVRTSTDADGVRINFDYDDKHRLRSVTDGVGNVTTLNYDVPGRLTSVESPLGEITALSYDEVGRLLTTTDALGATTSRTYDAAGRLDEFADALDAVPGISSTVDLSYDSRGLPQRLADQRGNATTLQYNDFGQMVVSAQPGGAEWTFEFAELGRMTRASSPDGMETTSIGYDVEGLVEEVATADGASVTVAYDVADRPQRVTDGNGIATDLRYNNTSGGQISRVTRAVGTVDEISIEYEYDDVGRLVEITGPRPGQTRTFDYSPGGRVRAITNANNETVIYRYDNAGRVAEVEMPGGRNIRYGYDRSGRITSVTSPTGLAYQTGYDSIGRPTAVTSPSGVTTRYTYNENGTVTSARIGDDQPAQFDVDSLVVSGSTDPNGGTSDYTYDDRYNLVKWVDQNGQATRYEYNRADRLTASTDALNRTTIFARDNRGRIASMADPSGRTFTPTYDPGGRVTAMTFADGSSQSITYDNLNRVRRVADVTASGSTVNAVNYSYDEAGNVTSVTESGPGMVDRRVEYRWDLLGNLTRITYPDGSFVDYEYDELGRMATANHSIHGETQYIWDDDSRLTNALFADGTGRHYDYKGEQLIGFSDGEKQWRLRYDDTGRLVEVTGANHWRYHYDTGGQLVEAHQDGQRWRYRYDAVGNLAEVVERPVGNPNAAWNKKGEFEPLPPGIAKKYPPDRFHHDVASQLSSGVVDGVNSTFTYDGAGRLASEQRADGDRIGYTYDSRGRLVEVAVAEAPPQASKPGRGNARKAKEKGSTVVTWARTYTADGLLATVSRSDNRGGKSQAWSLLWDRTRPVPEPLGWTASNGESVTLIHGVGPAMAAASDGNAARVALNPLGDVIGAPGGVAVGDGYTPFGLAVGDMSAGLDSFGLGFRGELHVGPTINLKARELSPRLSRFITPDPLTRSMGAAATSPYAYAANDPINLVDPFGLSPDDGSFQHRPGAGEFGGQAVRGDGGDLPRSWGEWGQVLQQLPGAVLDEFLEDPVGWIALTVVTVAATAAVIVTSPAWVTAAGIGALVAIGVTVGVGLLTGEFDPMTAAVNGVIGAALGGYSAASGGLTLLRTIGLEALGSGVADAALQVLRDGRSLGELNGWSVTVNAGIGGVSGGIFSGLGRSLNLGRGDVGYTQVFRFLDASNPATFTSNLSEQPLTSQLLTRLRMQLPGQRSLQIDRHMQGVEPAYSRSPFVSVLTSPTAASVTSDPWLRTIATGRPGAPGVKRAPDVAEFSVPNDRLYGPSAGNTLSQQETELLFRGDDLQDFLVDAFDNPFR